MSPHLARAAVFASCLRILAFQDSSAENAPKTPFEREFVRTFDEVRAARQSLATARTPEERTAAVIKLRRAVRSNPLLFVNLLAPESSVRSFLTELEEQRLDKQVGASSNAPGSTSLVSRGSVPSLLGFAVENGGLTQTVDGTSITFRGNPTGLIKALIKKDYLKSAITSDSDFWEQAFNKASFSISFDASRGGSNGVFTGSRRQISAYSFRYDIHNQRDPRNQRYLSEWERLRDGIQSAFATALTDFIGDMVSMAAHDEWVSRTADRLAEAADDKIESILREQLADYKDRVFRMELDANPRLKNGLERSIAAANTFAENRIAAVNRAMKSFLVTAEYSVLRQVATSDSLTSGNTVATLASNAGNLPELGTVKLIGNGRFLGSSEITANASYTIFQMIPKGVNTGRVRDWQLSVQTDTPLPDILGVGKPTLSFAGAFLRLMEQPLGAKVVLNGQDIDSRGSVGYGQAKLEFPLKGNGMKIPISLTYASRRQLLKNEKNIIGGNIGLTFDLDKLFAKGK